MTKFELYLKIKLGIHYPTGSHSVKQPLKVQFHFLFCGKFYYKVSLSALIFF